jgi:AcrR family transcriptional regulator
VSLTRRYVANDIGAYTPAVPKLWNDTIQTHRRAVREATIDTTAALVARHGLRAVTMSRIAEQTGIGRATLYKYFPDVESILRAWHERQVGRHLAQLVAARDKADEDGRRLRAVLEAYASVAHRSRGHDDAELAALLHHDEHVIRAQRAVHGIIRDVLAEAAASGVVRDDVPPDELATYCLHALAAAGTLGSRAALGRLIDVTLAGLRRSR